MKTTLFYWMSPIAGLKTLGSSNCTNREEKEKVPCLALAQGQTSPQIHNPSYDFPRFH